MKRIILLLGSLLAPAVVLGQAPTQFEWQEFSKRIKAAETIGTHGPDVVGDSVSLSNGALSFRATDISLPGHDALPVEFTRTYSVYNHPEFSVPDGMLSDWQIQAPSISGVFGPDWVVGVPATGNRCTSGAEPSTSIPYFTANKFWQGITLDVPGSSGELLRTAAGTTKPTSSSGWLWLTNDQTHFRCLSTIQNGTGEGFYAETADGIKYWFDYMAQTREPNIKSAPIVGSGSSFTLTRKKNWLYATRVEDRFGNYVNYTYTNAWNQPGKLTQIQSSDGRTITITYTSGRVSSVSNGVNNWTYTYGTTPKGRATLTGVGLPDSSSWTIAFNAFTDAEMISGASESCMLTTPVASSVPEPLASITHPSGAKGEFTVFLQEHGRSSVPVSCSNVLIGPGHPINDGSDDVNRWATAAYAWTLKQKKLSGPGLATAIWNYSYLPRNSMIMHPGTTASNPVCPVGTDCSVPLCTNATCARASETNVYGPDEEWTRYHHGNTYRYNEGLLVKVESGRWEPDNADAGTEPQTFPLRTVTQTYDLSPTGTTVYPKFYGTTQRDIGDAHPSQYHRPQLTAQTVQDGVTFTRTHQTLEYFAKPAQVLRQSSLGFHKTETFTYKNFFSPWVIGQVETVTCNSSSQPGCSGAPLVASVGYHPTTAMPTEYIRFGQTQQLLSYDTTSAVSTGQRGTVKTVTDGNLRTTTLSNWRRGIPRSVSYHDGTSQSALVSDQGWITQTTDELSNVTGYGYDTMGRVTSITWPAGHIPAWTNTTRAFEKVATAELGIPANHWRLTETTGSALKRTYYDALWRPLVTHESTSDASAVSRYTRRNFDINGRETFVSYPSATSAASTGILKEFDVLGRPVWTSQDSELGDLDTTTEYLSGFTTRVTNPRLNQTTTSFMVFDEPSYGLPRALSEPEGVTTTITRDAFGEPLTIARSGLFAGSTISATRTFVYDSFRRLCKRIDPESVATVMEYDTGGNLYWTARSSTLMSASDCQRASVTAAMQSVRSYDGRNRVTGINHPTGTADESYTYYADGALKTAATTDGGTWTYTYNNRRLPTGESLALDSRTFAIGYTYTANGHVSTLTYPSALSVAFNPNAIGEPQQAGAYATGVSYHPDGTLSGFSYGNGVVNSRGINARGLPAHIRDTRLGVARLDHTFTYDKNANITTIVDAVTGNKETRFLAYDARDRVTSAGASNMFGAEVYEYDPLDNVRRSAMSSTGTDTYAVDFYYIYDSNHQLDRINNAAGVAQYDYTHNLVGENTKRNGGGLNRTYAWNAAGRMTRGGTEDYVYDTHGHRTRATRTSPASTRYQIYNRSGQLLYAEDTRENERVDYIHLAGRLVAQRSRPIGTNTVTDRYHHTDTVGSASVETKANGDLHTRTLRTPWGQPYDGLYREGPGYAGHVTDQSTGLTYMQQRYYDPIALRFLSTDPVDVDGSNGSNFNRYWYANNNPVKFRDPDGRYIESVWDAANIAIGAGSAVNNVQDGNWGAAAVDVVGIGLDTLAMALPIVPGGAGTAIQASRAAENIAAAGQSYGGKAAVAGDAAMLNKQLASEHQVQEVLSGNGTPLVGAGTGRDLRDAPRLAETYGGEAADWAKVSSSSHTSPDGQSFSTHAYQNMSTDQVVEVKTKVIEENQ